MYGEFDKKKKAKVGGGTKPRSTIVIGQDMNCPNMDRGVDK